jgi:putative transposase
LSPGACFFNDPRLQSFQRQAYQSPAGATCDAESEEKGEGIAMKDQVIALLEALRQADSGTTIEEICRKMGVSEPTFYRWKKVYAGMGVTEIRRLKQLEDENAKLKRGVADLTLDKAMLQDVLRKKW